MKKLSRYLSIAFIIYIPLFWAIFPLGGDILAILNISIYILFFNKKINTRSIIFVIIIITIPLLSFQIENLLYPVRWIIYLSNSYIAYSILSIKTKYIVLYVVHILSLPIGFLYVEYMKAIDPYNLHLLGTMMFVGSRNHYAYFIIINYVLLFFLSKKLNKSTILLNFLSILIIVLSRSATGLITFFTIFVFLNGTKIYFKKIFSIKTLKILTILIIVIFATFLVDRNSEYLNLRESFDNTFNRLLNYEDDESFNIRTDIFFSNFNIEIYTRPIYENIIGNGRYVEFDVGEPYDNSFYAIFMSGGILLTLTLLLLILKNFSLVKKKYFLVIIMANLMYFMTANIFFELQNTISIIILLNPTIVFLNK